MDLKKEKISCPVCGETMSPFWREVGKTQKYVCRGKCWDDEDIIRSKKKGAKNWYCMT